MGAINELELASVFQSMDSPGASAYAAKVPHPYMRKREAPDICYLREGDIAP